jgi:hypothetical protein
MVGQIQIIAYILAVYLVYKGYEILHMSLVSPKEKKTVLIIIGAVAFAFSIIFAIGFVILMELQSEKVGNTFKNF